MSKLTHIDESGNARMVDVSMGGCCLLTTQPIPEEVTMRLELPGVVESDRLVLVQRMNSATVGQFEDRWRHGIRFLDLTDEDLGRVQTIVMDLQRDTLTDRANLRDSFQNPEPAEDAEKGEEQEGDGEGAESFEEGNGDDAPSSDEAAPDDPAAPPSSDD